MNDKNLIIRMFPSLGYFNLANLMTVLTIVLNILIIILAMRGETRLAFWLYIFVIGIDVFDGKIAGLLKCRSEFGARLDSICDGVSFCFMPAIIAFLMGFTGTAAIILVIINAVAGVWRLAYFDVKGLIKDGSHEYYIGSPTTRNAAIFFIVITVGGLFRNQLNILFTIFFAISPILMLMNIRIEKNGIFAKVLYAVVPVCGVAYLFIW